MRTALEIFLITVLVGACLSSCNRNKFGGGGDETLRSKDVSIEIKKISNASATSLGKGQIQVSAAYPLSLTCINCVTLGITLPFTEAPMDKNNKYVYTADLNYSLATRTVFCAVRISVDSKNSSDISALKTYKVYACPRQGAKEICDTTDAVPDCTHLIRR